MANRFSPQAYDPAKYETVKKQQEALKAQCKGVLRVSRICPYCNHRVDDVAKGDHGYCDFPHRKKNWMQPKVG